MTQHATVTFLLALVFSTGCYGNHLADAGGATSDASVDAAVSDSASPDTPVPPTPLGDVQCGPNICLEGEVCCDSVCGACTLPEECIDYECEAGRPRRG